MTSKLSVGSCRYSVLLALIVAVTGCGSSSSKTAGAEPVVGVTFATKAVAVCKSALADKQTWKPFPVSDFNPTDPDPSAFPQVANWLQAEVAPTFENWHDDLVALGDPPAGKRDWRRTIEAISKINQGNRDQIAAARAGDVDAFKATTSRMKDIQEDLLEASNAAGVPSCAEVHTA
jgi:hypothetical protein